MSLIEVKVPNIGDFKDVEVIEVLVKAGETIRAEQSLVTVESDKASMEIPSSAAGVVKDLKVKVGDKVSEGMLLLMLEEGAGGAEKAPAEKGANSVASGAAARPAASSAAAPAAAAAPSSSAPPAASPTQAPATREAAPESAPESAPRTATHPVPSDPHDNQHIVKPHASPSVRLFARELGVDLSQVTGSGPKLRITHDDVRNYVKGVVAQAGAGGSAGAPAAANSGAGLGLIPWPKVDFAKHGPIEIRPQLRIKKIAAANLHRNWVMIPHVTNHDDADITELESFRLLLNAENAKAGIKVTMLAFLVKACVAALKKFPEFNSSLDGENLVLKQYYHIGFAADTPNGLTVPVIKDADRKGIFQIARETSELASKAREGKLGPGDMQGGTFSISSLGGIGGTYFTPIINAPEVAILGVCRSIKRPVWNESKGEFEPRLILPLSLSWDHRVVDGAAAARFNVYLTQLLGDFRRTML